MMSLTCRETELKRYIVGHINKRGVAPTFEEMAGYMGVKSKSAVHRMVTSLESRGHIRRQGYRARAIEVVSAHSPLAHFSTADLLAELQRREQGK